MTPGIDAARTAGTEHRIHEYDHDPNSQSYGTEAADKLAVDPARVFKTLVVTIDGKELVVGLVPVTTQLNLKRIAKAARGKKATMAEKTTVQRSTGYVLGGVSPLGQKRRLRSFIDDSALGFDTIFVSAGRRGLEIELAPQALCRLIGATVTHLQQS